MDIKRLNKLIKQLEDFAPSASIYSEHPCELTDSVDVARKKLEDAILTYKENPTEETRLNLAQCKAEFEKLAFYVDDVLQDEQMGL